MNLTSTVKALTFDVFGTVVDWRSGISARVRRSAGSGTWRRTGPGSRMHGALYLPALERVRSGQMPWTALDDVGC